MIATIQFLKSYCISCLATLQKKWLVEVLFCFAFYINLNVQLDLCQHSHEHIKKNRENIMGLILYFHHVSPFVQAHCMYLLNWESSFVFKRTFQKYIPVLYNQVFKPGFMNNILTTCTLGTSADNEVFCVIYCFYVLYMYYVLHKTGQWSIKNVVAVRRSCINVFSYNCSNFISLLMIS